MSSGFEIEQIVQEVLRRLAVSRAPAVAPEASEIGDLQVEEEVVALETLRNRLEGVRRVVVQQSAVLTPAVRDELRGRGIELVRTNSPACLPASLPGETVLLCVQLSSGWDGLVALLNQPTKRCSAEDAVEEMATLLNQAKQVICLAESPARLTCLANRDPRIRAAAVECTEQVCEARSELDANVWVVDPRRKHRFETRNLVRHICS